MIQSYAIVEGPRWPASRVKLIADCRKVGAGIVEGLVKAGWDELQADPEVPVYKSVPEGTIFPPPQRQSESFTKADFNDVTGLDFIRSVVRTIAAQDKLPVDFPGEDGKPSGALKAALAAPVHVETEGDIVWAGFANREQLDRETAYQAKLILRRHLVTDNERGRPPDYTKSPVRAKQPHNDKQFLWWNWKEKRWKSWAVLALPSGQTRGIDGSGAPMIDAWRGSIWGGSGYWADVEFGTEGYQPQLDGAGVPAEGDSMVSFYLNAGGGIGVVKSQSRGGSTGIPARRFLARAAMTVARGVNDAAKAEFGELLMDELGEW